MDKILIKQEIQEGSITPLRGAFLLVLSEKLPIQVGETKHTKFEESALPKEGFYPVRKGRFITSYRKEIEEVVPQVVSDETELETLSDEKLRELAQAYKKEVKQVKHELESKEPADGASVADSVLNDQETK